MSFGTRLCCLAGCIIAILFALKDSVMIRNCRQVSVFVSWPYEDQILRNSKFDGQLFEIIGIIPVELSRERSRQVVIDRLMQCFLTCCDDFVHLVTDFGLRIYEEPKTEDLQIWYTAKLRWLGYKLDLIEEETSCYSPSVAVLHLVMLCVYSCNRFWSTSLWRMATCMTSF